MTSLNLKIGTIIQARMLSTRLPKKILLPLSGKTVLEHVIERCQKSQFSTTVIVATTVRPEDQPIADFMQKLGVPVWRGSEENVLERYRDAAKHYGLDVVVRVTSDCPLIDAGIIDDVIHAFISEKADIAANITERTFPRGFDVEVVSFAALEKAMSAGLEPFDLEHVTPYFYRNPRLFRTAAVRAKDEMRRPDIRICIDQQEDYDLLKKIFKFRPGSGNFAAKEIVGLFNRFPEWLEINRNVHHLTGKGKT